MRVAAYLIAVVLVGSFVPYPRFAGAQQHRIFDEHSHAKGGSAIEPSENRNFQARRPPAVTGPADFVTRNAIGLPVKPRAVSQGLGGPGLPGSATPLFPMQPRMAGPFGGGSGNAGSRSVTVSRVSPIATPLPLPGARIEGAWMSRRVAVPAAIGGPARAVAGIDGTKFRRRP